MILAGTGCTAFFVYLIVVPIWMVKRLKDPIVRLKEKTHREFGYLYLRYKDDQWFFEFFVLAQKALMRVTSMSLSTPSNNIEALGCISLITLCSY